MPPLTPLERHLQKAKDDIIQAFRVKIGVLSRRLENVETPSALPPIASPVRGVDFAREPNVTALMRAAIESRNSSIPKVHERYIQFRDDVSDKKLNSDTKDALGVLMLQHIGPEFGKLSWSKASKSTHIAQCEMVIQKAAESRDFTVYRQSSNLWCIRRFGEQRMKSKKSAVKGKKLEPGSVGEVMNCGKTENFGTNLSTCSPRNEQKKSSDGKAPSATPGSKQTFVDNEKAYHIAPLESFAEDERIRKECC
ncbi:hypothetical protein FGB62_31g115 [Gracilaria domingensis]|nr:hypothetical protein FGB62_31g115 [Gracilaria domingensis]